METEFLAPPEAPVFEPTIEEFADPLAFINKIRPIGEKTGIIKIKPPSEWQPPFAVDVDTFRFTPRIQKLNEMEALSRIKLNFLDALAKFWDLQGQPISLQGTQIRVPNVERRVLDLYLLHKMVNEEGGFEQVTRERRWARISSRMDFPSGKGVGTILRQHYERLLYPYDLFKAGVTVDPDRVRIKQEVDDDKKVDKDYKPKQKTPTKDPDGVRRSKRVVKEEPFVDYTANSELKKLQFFGAGPKTALPNLPVKKEEELDQETFDNYGNPKRNTRKGFPMIDLYMCHSCGSGDAEGQMLLCDNCDDAFHTFCLVPPLTDIPKGDWRCPRCVAEVCNKPREAYGFDQSLKTYTLQEFGEKADDFKAHYFNMPVHMVGSDTLEKEFWHLVNAIDEDVVVEYGADIHAVEMGSGFPTKDTEDHFPEDEDYIKSPWNLNNIAIHERSVLCNVNADISGMKIPWCYVGMCFSCFAWHVEDHWSYSINYMHWGEPKTWYGVPGAQAEDLEEVMKRQAGELFTQAPDLLHHITTIMNPNILMEHGVSVVRTNQCAGEFVVTFPRSYHAGYNQGYNFAEAVNFCPADWLPLGRACVEHYRQLKRQLVFSHEELICKMAADPDGLDLMTAATTYEDMLAMVESEKKLRKSLLDVGITEAEREAFELLPDDERQCLYCKTTCFLSAITCPCNPNNLVCIHHVKELCNCPTSRLCLRYRYTLDELPAMLHRLKVRAESFDTWAKKVKNALEALEPMKLDLVDMKGLVSEAEIKKFPDSELLDTLKEAVQDAEKCASVAAQLVSKKQRTRHRQSGEMKYVAKLTLDELEQFLDQVKSLPCIIKEATALQELLTKVKDYQNEAVMALEEETPNSEKLEKLVEIGVTLDVDLLEIPKLKQVLRQAHWLDEVRNTLAESTEVTLESMRKLLESGVSLAPHRAVEKAMGELQELLTISERWEEKARICLQARPRHVITTLEAIINEAKGIPAYLPNVSALKDALKRAKEWTAKVDNVQTGEHYPYLDVLENLVNRGRPIPVRLDALPQVESQVAAAKSWRERTARTFLKKNSSYSLVEVLSPRSDIGVYSSSKSRRKKNKENERDKENVNGETKMEEYIDPASMVASFKAAEQSEIDSMRALRAKCMEKHRQDDAQDQKYCVCRKQPSSMMLQCELCKDWFHANCVPLPKSTNMKNKASQAAAVQAAKELKFLCPLCLRSRRPRLETILSLLVSLQKLPVRLPEGEALQCLTERAMAWQDRARQALATEELASALAKLSVLSQKMVEQAAREKTEKIINAELLKAACNPELQGHLQSVTQSAFGSGGVQSSNSLVTVMDIETSSGGGGGGGGEVKEEKVEEESEDISVDADTAQTPSTGMSEHAYSTASKGGSTVAPSPRKHQRKSPLIPRQLEAPVLELSDMARAQLEELMMEGDLLEVSLDETQHIWRILQACSNRGDDKFMQFENGDVLDSIKIKTPKDKDGEHKKKKRKKEKDEDGLRGEEKTKKKKLKHKDKEHKDCKEKTKIKEEKKDKDGNMRDKEKKKKKKRPDGEKKMKKKTMGNDKNGDLVVIDDEDDSEDCSAAKCLKPTGDEVNWVQCDTCELWFHLLCIGMSEDEVAGNEDYSCFTCRNKDDKDLPPVLTPHISLVNCMLERHNKENESAPDIDPVDTIAEDGDKESESQMEKAEAAIENMDICAEPDVVEKSVPEKVQSVEKPTLMEETVIENVEKVDVIAEPAPEKMEIDLVENEKVNVGDNEKDQELVGEVISDSVCQKAEPVVVSSVEEMKDCENIPACTENQDCAQEISTPIPVNGNQNSCET